jgi:hypothetical protein
VPILGLYQSVTIAPITANGIGTSSAPYVFAGVPTITSVSRQVTVPSIDIISFSNISVTFTSGTPSSTPTSTITNYIGYFLNGSNNKVLTVPVSSSLFIFNPDVDNTLYTIYVVANTQDGGSSMISRSVYATFPDLTNTLYPQKPTINAGIPEITNIGNTINLDTNKQTLSITYPGVPSLLTQDYSLNGGTTFSDSVVLPIATKNIAGVTSSSTQFTQPNDIIMRSKLIYYQSNQPQPTRWISSYLLIQPPTITVIKGTVQNPYYAIYYTPAIPGVSPISRYMYYVYVIPQNATTGQILGNAVFRQSGTFLPSVTSYVIPNLQFSFLKYTIYLVAIAQNGDVSLASNAFTV